jgi:acyl-coenzyme A synthetase/AMP-(fatty) acid ligase/acyl carrier protein
MPARADEHIRAKCFHPSGKFVEFPIEDIERSIPERFEKIARMYPDRIAIKAGNHVVRYDQLDALADRVARKLIGVFSGNKGPVCMLIDNGPVLAAAMLGILKAGKFFILLDPSFPKARLSALLRDSQSSLLVYQKRHLSLARDIAAECRILEIESIGTADYTKKMTVSVEPNDLATVFYTTGSTGQPKGVVHTHRSLLHMIFRRTNTLHVSPEDRWSLLSSGTSNVVIISLGAMLNGAALVACDDQGKVIPQLKTWLLREQITICWISVQFFRILCDSLTERNCLPTIRVVRLTSETARRSDFELYKRCFADHCILVNALSSSETGVTMKYFMNHHSQVDSDELPVGYPVEGIEIQLLNDEGCPVGFNNIGEIVVRSKYVASEYWCNPALTAAKFKRDPHDSETQSYYTGDLGLMLPDSCLVHKGRKDFRTKIRGYGVDLVEVEKALISHPDINEAVVTARTNAAKSAYLIAYFTFDRKQSFTVSELREYLKAKLPEYMIPPVFVKLEKIPLTLNGKVDRNALPMPDNSRPELDGAFVAPRSHTERRLAEIWAEVLDLDSVGVYDNFFDLGGHSLAATRVVARVYQRFQLEIPLQALFESPTVAEMAAVINEHLKEPLGNEELESILKKIESLSDEDAQRLISEHGRNDPQS